jgi:hypothetical protein
MMEKPGSLISASFFGFFEALAARFRFGGVKLMEPYPESPKVAEEPGDGVKMGGENPDDWDWVGLCSKDWPAHVEVEGKTSYLRTRAPVLRSTVALL